MADFASTAALLALTSFLGASRFNCRDLQRFKKANGHCYVHPSADKQLFNWIRVQRKDKRRRDRGEGGPASDERVRLLDAVGLDWNPALTGGIKANSHLC